MGSAKAILSLVAILSTVTLTSPAIFAAGSCPGTHRGAMVRESLAIASFIDHAKRKISLIQTIARFLEVPLEDSTKWDISYLHGKNRWGQNRNVQIENLTYKLMHLTPEQLNQEAKKAIDDESMMSINPLIDSGRLGIVIQDANYHHSWMMGNHPTEHARFYLRTSHKSQIVSVKETETTLEVVITEKWVENGKRDTYYQKMLIDKSSLSEIRIQITNWKDRFFSLARSATVFLPNLKVENRPLVDSQTKGI